MTARVGQKAPDFDLPSYHKGSFKHVKLSDYAGKWLLLYFYPGDFTFVWATELSAVAGKYADLQQMDVDVVSVSVDSYYVHKMWNDYELSKMVEGGVPFQMGADQNGRMGSEYGVWNEAAGVEQRGRFLIDPDGVIQSIEIIGNPVGQNVNENIRQVQAFQYIRAANGKEACPASWMPGQQTLTPRPGLVGNVWKSWTPK